MHRLLNIHSIYLATEGEGLQVGRPQVFVRFQGCAIACVNCDSKETWSFEPQFPMSLEKVLSEIESLSPAKKIRWISITGGDPLHPKNLEGAISLAKALKKRGNRINIEAAGTRVPHELFDLVDYISFDIKTPKTGVQTSLNKVRELISQYSGRFQLKSVIEDKEDFEYISELEEKLSLEFEQELPWVLTPCYHVGEEFPRQRFIDIISLNEKSGGRFRVIGQQHKWVYGSSKLNV